MMLSIVISCFNEDDTIHAIIDAVIASPYEEKEIIILDDEYEQDKRPILQNQEVSTSPKVSSIPRLL